MTRKCTSGETSGMEVIAKHRTDSRLCESLSWDIYEYAWVEFDERETGYQASSHVAD